ncbi:translesion error-prone DNA polymerase V autoproteolytic subunit [Thorsellia kenyensis]|uniref:Translesion error-prone DNA polymerase V autoproteolytic subunit n=1 Tax=Thorsellia kenyensis TaxID=1549888 RepID=A0ABV6CBF3_9GAMM
MDIKFVGKVSESYGLPESIYLPFYLSKVSAGFPSPAQDYVENTLDLNELCIQHPSATFFVRVEGESMIEAGIYSGDILIVDRAITAAQGDIVIVNLNGEFTVKELQLTPQVALVAHNPKYPIRIIKEGDELDIFGVVTNVIRKLPRHKGTSHASSNPIF